MDGEITWSLARQELVRTTIALSDKIQPQKEADAELYFNTLKWAALTAILMFVGCVIEPYERVSNIIALLVTLLLIAILSKLVSKVLDFEKREVAFRLKHIAECYNLVSNEYNSVSKMMQFCSKDNDSSPNSQFGGSNAASPSSSSDPLNKGSSMTGIIHVWREGKWHRVPLMLVVKGDIIALSEGDEAPAKMVHILTESELLSSHERSDGSESNVEEGNIGEGTSRRLSFPPKPNTNPPTRRPSVENIPSSLPPKPLTNSNNFDYEEQEREEEEEEEEDSLLEEDPNQTYVKRGERVKALKSNMPEGVIHLSEKSESLLDICDELQMFKLLETPLKLYLKKFIRNINDPYTELPKPPLSDHQVSLLFKKLSKFRFRFLILSFIAGVVRICIFQFAKKNKYDSDDSSDGSRIDKLWVSNLIMYPAVVALCMLCASGLLSFLNVFIEILALAQLLSITATDTLNEDPFLVQDIEQWRKRHSNKTSYEPVSPRKQDSFNGLHKSSMRTKRHNSITEARKIRVIEKSNFRSKLGKLYEIFRKVLSFRLGNADFDDFSYMNIPLKSYRLIERLGCINMLCVVDDEIVSEPFSVPEEVYFKENSSASKVLDLYYKGKNDSERGKFDSGFEDPNWWKFLASLKPIGLCALATTMNEDDSDSDSSGDDVEDFEEVSTIFKAEQSNEKSKFDKSTTTPSSVTSSSSPSSIYDTETIIKVRTALIEHIKAPQLFGHLTQLSKEIGFIPRDLEYFNTKLKVMTFDKKYKRFDRYNESQEDLWRRGNIHPLINSVVIEDLRYTNIYQLFSQGNSPLHIVNSCTDLWDGDGNISPLLEKERSAIIKMYQQWLLEDMDVVAFSYAPIPHHAQHFFQDDTSKPPLGKGGDNNCDGASFCLPKSGKIYFVKNSASEEHSESFGKIAASSTSTTPTPSVATSVATPSSQTKTDILQNTANATSTPPPTTFKTAPGGKRIVEKIRYERSYSTLQRNNSNMPKLNKLYNALWSLINNQVFLGMVAFTIPLKPRIQHQIEQVMHCGVRYVFFSSRNMRRSKALSEKMGLETEWNCAISLREVLDSNEPDWSVKAQMPHGTKAIRKHIEEVDNVPLLVSMFADATPDSIEDMIDVFQENNETTLVLGTSYRASNFELFTSADLSIAISSLPQGMTYDEFPSINNPTSTSSKKKHSSSATSSYSTTVAFNPAAQLVKSDLKFNEKIIALSSGFILPNTPAHEESCLTHVTELLHEGRRLYLNIHQVYTFVVNTVGVFSVVISLDFLMPVSSSSHFHFLSLIEFQFVVFVFVSLPMLITDSHHSMIKQTQCKNDKYSTNSGDIKRFWFYLYARTIPIGLVCYIMKIWSFGLYLVQVEKKLNLFTKNNIDDNSSSLIQNSFNYCRRKHDALKWYNFLWCEEIENNKHADTRYEKHLHYAHVASHVVMMFFLLLNILCQSSSFLYRTKSVFVLSPFKHNKFWLYGCISALILHTCYSLLYLFMIIGEVDFGYLSWQILIFMLVFPFFGLLLYEKVKSYDAKSYDTFMKFLQLEFDTRLGMYSPR